jgi:hypothetical protein
MANKKPQNNAKKNAAINCGALNYIQQDQD